MYYWLHEPGCVFLKVCNVCVCLFVCSCVCECLFFCVCLYACVFLCYCELNLQERSQHVRPSPDPLPVPYSSTESQCVIPIIYVNNLYWIQPPLNTTVTCYVTVGHARATCTKAYPISLLVPPRPPIKHRAMDTSFPHIVGFR